MKKGFGIVFFTVCSLLLLFSFAGCTTAQTSNLDFYDNAVLQLMPHDLLSDRPIRVELNSAVASSSSSLLERPDETTRTQHDRILEKIRETYPEADEVLISSFESVTKQSGSGQFVTYSYTYVANVLPIKFR